MLKSNINRNIEPKTCIQSRGKLTITTTAVSWGFGEE